MITAIQMQRSENNADYAVCTHIVVGFFAGLDESHFQASQAYIVQITRIKLTIKAMLNMLRLDLPKQFKQKHRKLNVVRISWGCHE